MRPSVSAVSVAPIRAYTEYIVRMTGLGAPTTGFVKAQSICAKPDPRALRVTYAAGMGKKKKPGDASTPAGSPDGPPGKKQRRKARKSSKKRS
jgi:hypothetical protein